MLKRLLLVPFLLLAIWAAPAHAADDTLHFRLGEDPETLFNAKTVSLTANSVIGGYLLDRLVYFDADGHPQPWLATGWTISPDQKVLTFKLRTGVKFTDGTDFNAQAAKYQFDYVMDKKNASPLLSRIGTLQKVEAPDDTTLIFTFEKPYAPFFSYLASGSFGFNSPTAMKKQGDQYGRNPVGTGPYMLKSWVPGTEITLERNPHYQQFRGDALNKGLPYAKTIVLTVISEEAVAQAALESGELTAGSVAADAIDNLIKNPALKTVINKTVTNLLFLEYNEMHAPFDSETVRRAMGYAINRTAIVKAAFNNYAHPMHGPLANGIPGYDASIGEKYGETYNPAKAKALFAEAGYKPGADGKLAKDGKPLVLSLKSYSGFETIDRTLAVIQSNLADLGIKTTIETADWGSFYPSLLKPDWDMDLMRWTSSDASVLTFIARSPGHRNATLANPKQDEILDRCQTLVDQAQRNVCVGEAQTSLLQTATFTPILSDWLITITQANVKGYHLDYFNSIIPGDIQVAD
jgi:peptide/nickel transport system substrate-binding protein